jgi:general secretion pathway protein N
MAGEQMIRRCVCVIAAMASFFVNGAFGQAPTGASLGNAADQPSQNAEQQLAAAKNPDPRQPPPGGNPLWGTPLSALSATHERPLFSASRRPPAPPAPPMPVVEAPPPPPPAAPEQPPLTLVGTAVGNPQNVALILNQATRTLVRLHVGEEAAGWCLRSVDSRTMTLEKNSQQVTLSLPVPGALPANPQPVAIAGLFPTRRDRNATDMAQPNVNKRR